MIPASQKPAPKTNPSVNKADKKKIFRQFIQPENEMIYLENAHKLYPNLPDGAEKEYIAECLKYLGKNLTDNFIINTLIENQNTQNFTLTNITPLQEHVDRVLQTDDQGHGYYPAPERKEFLDQKNTIKILNTHGMAVHIPVFLLTKEKAKNLLDTHNTNVQIEKDMGIIFDRVATWNANVQIEKDMKIIFDRVATWKKI